VRAKALIAWRRSISCHWIVERGKIEKSVGSIVERARHESAFLNRKFPER
jgi:hypothetical protein